MDLKVLRQKKGLTQSDVAARLGYSSPQFISNWERGLSDVPENKFKAIARLYDVSLDFLISRKLKSVKTRLMKRYGSLK